MPVTRFGDDEPVYGLQAETTLGYIQEFNQKEEMAGEATVEDHEGYVVAYALFDKRWSGGFAFIAKTGSTLPVVATAQALVNLQDIDKVIIKSKDRKPEQKGFEKHTYDYVAFERIVLT